MGKMIGMDFGTTNSCVAVVEGGVLQVIPNQEAARTTCSTVAFTATGERVVGCLAVRQALTNLENTIFGVRRLMGAKFDSPERQRARRVLPKQLVASANGELLVQVNENAYSPPEIASLVLQKLRGAAEDYLGEPVEGAVIAVPTHFNDPQRRATKDAAKIAGLDNVRLISDSTAAALAYWFTCRRPCSVELREHDSLVLGYHPGVGDAVEPGGSDPETLAVYDLGGGTFEITVLEIEDGLCRVRATAGDTSLGGEDLDQRIIDWLVHEFQIETRIDLTQDRKARQLLNEAAQRAKCELSTALRTEIVLPLRSDTTGASQLSTYLTRERYEALSNDLLERTIWLCRRALAEANLKPDEIDDVLLVGAPTRAPKVREVVRRVFGRQPSEAINLDEGVALGAAIQAGILQGEVGHFILEDLMPHAVGLEVGDDRVRLFDSNSTIPARASRVFTTATDDQSRIGMRLLQGEGSEPFHYVNRTLTEIEVTSIPAAPKGVPQIEVGFEIDVDGIVSVFARDQATGRAQSMTIYPCGGLSEDEVNRLAGETRAREVEEWQKDYGAVVYHLEDLVAHTTCSVQAIENKLNSDERELILQATRKAKKALENGKREGDVERKFWESVVSSGWVVRLRVEGRNYRSRLASLEAARAGVLTRAAVDVGDNGTLTVPIPGERREVAPGVIVEQIGDPGLPPLPPWPIPELMGLNGPREAPALVMLRFLDPGPDAIGVRVPLPPRPGRSTRELRECLVEMDKVATLVGQAKLRP